MLWLNDICRTSWKLKAPTSSVLFQGTPSVPLLVTMVAGGHHQGPHPISCLGGFLCLSSLHSSNISPSLPIWVTSLSYWHRHNSEWSLSPFISIRLHSSNPVSLSSISADITLPKPSSSRSLMTPLLMNPQSSPHQLFRTCNEAASPASMRSLTLIALP